jgi:small-conductance mechanosensitive channel
LGLGVAAGLVFFPALAPFQAAAFAWASWLAYAQAAAAILASRFLEKGATGFIQRLGDSRGWSPQSTVLAKLSARLAVYLVGGSVALRFLGLTWSALLASLGATSIVLGWASADVIGNLIQGFWILLNHPFSIGDRIEVAGSSGAIVDMNLNYVVLADDDASHTLVPYAVLKSSPFKVLAGSSQGAAK